MKATSHQLALVSALVVGAWLIPSASVSDAGTSLSDGDARAALWPEHLYLAQADAEPVDRPVSFTNEQADRGEEEYESECKECHGDDLKGGLVGGPPLRGLAFEEHFANGMPASGLFGYISSTMPPNAPGRFSPSTYADLMAYILKRNGFQPGVPLPSDFDALDYLIMEK